MNIASHNQIVIIGAGPTGTLLALELQQQGKQVVLIESRKPCEAVSDTRTLALSYASIQMLLSSGVHLSETDWTPITHVHVSSQDCFGRTLFSNQDLHLPYLGVVIDYQRLIHACDQALWDSGITVLWETKATNIQTVQNYAMVTFCDNAQKQSETTCDWCVVAEGGHLADRLPELKRKVYDYQQSAVVATVDFSSAHQGRAFERFTKEGALVLLPYQNDNRCRLVWTLKTEEAQNMLSLDDEAFIQRLLASFGSRLGKIETVSNKAAFPLFLKQLNQPYSGRVFCIGNAAQTMHPVAAQGLNLGLRDAKTLSQFFAKDHWSKEGHQLTEQYARARKLDAHSIVAFTHILVTFFEKAPIWLQHGRGMTLSVLNSVPFLRKKFIRSFVYGVKPISKKL